VGQEGYMSRHRAQSRWACWVHIGLVLAYVGPHGRAVVGQEGYISRHRAYVGLHYTLSAAPAGQNSSSFCQNRALLKTIWPAPAPSQATVLQKQGLTTDYWPAPPAQLGKVSFREGLPEISYKKKRAFGAPLQLLIITYIPFFSSRALKPLDFKKYCFLRSVFWAFAFFRAFGAPLQLLIVKYIPFFSSRAQTT